MQRTEYIVGSAMERVKLHSTVIKLDLIMCMSWSQCHISVALGLLLNNIHYTRIHTILLCLTFQFYPYQHHNVSITMHVSASTSSIISFHENWWQKITGFQASEIERTQNTIPFVSSYMVHNITKRSNVTGEHGADWQAQVV